MTPKKEAAGGVNNTAADSTTTHSRNPTATVSRLKALIVGAVCWGLLPITVADCIVRCLRLRRKR